jgi:hypothetical protein
VSGHEHELALDLAALESRERLAGLRERQRRIDRGAQLALGDPAEQLLAVSRVISNPALASINTSNSRKSAGCLYGIHHVK